MQPLIVSLFLLLGLYDETPEQLSLNQREKRADDDSDGKEEGGAVHSAQPHENAQQHDNPPCEGEKGSRHLQLPIGLDLNPLRIVGLLPRGQFSVDVRKRFERPHKLNPILGVPGNRNWLIRLWLVFIVKILHYSNNLTLGIVIMSGRPGPSPNGDNAPARGSRTVTGAVSSFSIPRTIVL